MTNKKWVMGWLLLVLTLLLVLGGFTAVIDPYFHYHSPLSFLAYPTIDPRYQNNGIMRHTSYDAVITGTSMTENFKASEVDAVFGVQSIKVPCYGGTYREINDQLEFAVAHNDRLRLVVRGLDYSYVTQAPDAMRYEANSLPTYLYDDNPLNDVNYLFNKSVLLDGTCRVLEFTKEGGHTPDFDEYCNWMAWHTIGREAVKASYIREEKNPEMYSLTDTDRQNIRENARKNITMLAQQHPEMEFYCFFTPYSIYYWDDLNQIGEIERQLDGERYLIEQILPYPNIHLFSFFTEYDLICNLDVYRDMWHYSEDINSQILEWMQDDSRRLTWENYEAYCDTMRAFYLGYDYEELFWEQ